MTTSEPHRTGSAPPGFAGRVAAVTGGGSGIGAAVVRRLHDQDAVITVMDRNDTGATVAEAISATFLRVDVADRRAVDEAIAAVVEEHGRLDVLVHAAGVDDPVAKQRIADAVAAGEPVNVTANLDEETWRDVLSVNLDGSFHVLRAGVRAMRHGEGGTIVLLGSSAGFDTPVGYPHYSASKAGVHALAQSVAKEVIRWGIRVNVVAPGPTDTGMTTRTPKVLRDRFMQAGSGRYATPEEIADIVLFLANEVSSNIVGAVVLANGGLFTA